MTTNTRTLEFTSYIMAVSYGIENAWIRHKLTPDTIDYSNPESEGLKQLSIEIDIEIKELTKRLQKQFGKDITLPPIPSDQLQYLHSYHDVVTGMTGVAFLDVANQEIIIGYVGTQVIYWMTAQVTTIYMEMEATIYLMVDLVMITYMEKEEMIHIFLVLVVVKILWMIPVVYILFS